MKEFLHFTASWCAPCKAMAPKIDEMIAGNPDINYIKVDLETSEGIELAKQYNVSSIPTFIAKINNEQSGRHLGLATVDQLEELFK